MEIAFKHTLSESITPALLETSVQSFVSSKRYVYAMLKASLFNIIYRRLPVNEKELIVKRYEDIPFVVHKSVSRRGVTDSWFVMFCDCVPAIKDTFNKNYLKTLYMYMRNSKNEILETYRFDLKYNKDSAFSYKTKDNKTPKEVSVATKTLFGSIIKLGSVEKLGKDTILEFKIVVADCPLDYTPPRCQVIKSVNEDIRKFTIMGEIKTGFHKMVSRSSGFEIPLENAEMDIIPTLDTPIFLSKCQDAANSSTANIKNYKRKSEILNVPEEENGNELSSRKKFNISNVTYSDRNETTMTVDSVSDTSRDAEISCICKLQAPDYVQIIICDSCKQPFHAPCFGYFTEHPNVAFKCTDCRGQKLTSKFSLLCKLRLILICITKSGLMPKEITNSISEVDEKEVFERMKHLKLCEPESKSLSEWYSLKTVFRITYCYEKK